MKMNRIEKKFVNSRRRAQRNLRLVDQLLGMIDVTRVTKILEIGCGAGAVAAHLASRYPMKVIGTDLDPEMVGMARRYQRESKNLNFAEADATRLPFVDSEFDMVVSLKVIHHVGDWRGALREVCRVLRPNGFFIFNDIAGSELMTRILRGIVKNYGVYTANEITDFLERNNLGIVYKERLKGMGLRHCNIVFQKGHHPWFRNSPRGAVKQNRVP
ncbi:MAG: methyltransferase domain-containing protein [Proteobacteria bacterium]|nr:methyltransferase domain-containing protein [Pseudomonadota bacterium]NIS71143.1 methyltransferase domain-containing protein [Pseudomonadota bacterium]